MINKIISGFLNLLFPPRCRICGRKSDEAICVCCFETLPRINGSICMKCGKPCHRTVDECRECSGKRLHFSLARSGGSYKDGLKKAIHELKYKNGKKLVPHLAKFVSTSASDLIRDADAIAFVPLSKRKEAKRGYNQSKLIADELSLIFNKPMYHGLVKVKEIPEQNKLGLAGRSANVRGAFTATSPIRGKIILIDDVYTTGSTVNECALALRKAGAREICVVTVTRTPLIGR